MIALLLTLALVGQPAPADCAALVSTATTLDAMPKLTLWRAGLCIKKQRDDALSTVRSLERQLRVRTSSSTVKIVRALPAPSPPPPGLGWGTVIASTAIAALVGAAVGFVAGLKR